MNTNAAIFKPPMVSIVTVVLNDVGHIEQTILSVLNQTYPHIEYIIIDGGSTDGTVDVIKKYADRLAFWVSEPDGGIFQGMNKGIDHVTGEWVNFMNSGDYFYQTDVFEKIFTDPTIGQADCLYGGFIGQINGQPVLCEAYDDVKSMAWKGLPLGHQTLFARTELVKKYKFNTKYKVSADGDFVLHCIAEGRIFKKVEPIIYQVGTMGFSHNNQWKARFENWSIARKYFGGIRTDLFFLWSTIYAFCFGIFKKVTPRFIYSFFKKLYQPLKKKISYKRYKYTWLKK
jgi:glycosyltransferase involved in cell wall biosynthesis